MAKTRGVEVVKEGGRWWWVYAGHRWDFRLEPYKDRGLYRDGNLVAGCISTSAIPLCCPDDAVLFSIGYECHRDSDKPEGDAA